VHGEGDILYQIGLCVVAATTLAYVAKLLRQPLMLAYLAAGVLIGPIGLKQISDQHSIERLAELGLAFLLFIVGLEIDVKKLLDTGRVASITTVVQVAGCALLGWVTAYALGFRGLEAMYLGAAVSFSSTMIVVKLLADRFELDTAPGHVTLGILLFQDVLAIVVLAIQPELGGGGGGDRSPVLTIGLAGVRGLGLLFGALAISRWILPPIFRFVAKVPEAMLLSAISWCFVVCFAALEADFSVAMGALIAGVSMSAFPYSLDVVSKLQSLRDFFVTLFFVSLGMLITPPTVPIIVATLVLSAVCIASRFVTVWPMVRAFGGDNRTGLLSSIHLAQTSEFALIIVLIGVSTKYGHIRHDIVSIVVLSLVVTSTISTYLIQFSHKLVKWALRRSQGTALEDAQAKDTRRYKRNPAKVVLVGCFRTGSSLVHELLAAGKKESFAVIDFSPSVHAGLERLGVSCNYGDISNLDVLHHAGVERAEVLIASISDDFLRGIDNRRLLDLLKKANPHAKVIVSADRIDLARKLYVAGADFVHVPRLASADCLIDALRAVEDGTLEQLRTAHLARLEQRDEVVA
jgi:Kef-type K+ transport system membrane component KefB/voltage-gated potassium channel Kch